MKLREIKETRAAKIAEMQGLHTAASDANRELGGEERKRFDALETEVRGLTGRLADAEKMAEFERLADAGDTAGDPHFRSLTGAFNVAKAVTEGMAGRMTGREAEYAQEVERRSGARAANGIRIPIPTAAILGGETRALTTSTPGAGPGSNLVATNLAAMTDHRRAALVIERMGATVLRNLTGNLDLPRLSASGTAAWVAEHTNATRSDAQLEKRSMGPKTVTAEYEISRRMLIQSNEALDTILRADLAYLLAAKMDAAAIRGGSTDEPVGILADAEVLSVTGGAFNSTIAANLIGALQSDNVSGSAAFLTNPAVLNAARKILDTNARVIPMAELFHGERVESSTQVPGDLGVGTDKNGLIYGEWASLYLGYWSNIDLLANPYHSDVASKGGTLLHAFLDTDVVVRHPEGFRYAKIG